MKKTLKRIVYGLLSALLLFCLLMAIPRAHGLLFPEKPPMGYHFLWTSYLAIVVGLEDLIDREPGIPDEIRAFENIEYKVADGQSLQLDILRPKESKGPVPLLVFFHGGGWRKGNRADMLPLLIDFTRKGYATATVSYRLARPYPECVEDATEAVNWLFHHGNEYGYDAGRIALIGGSAGAHLAMMAGYGWKAKTTHADSVYNYRVKAVINIFGPVDMTTDFARHHPTAISFMAKTYEEAPELYREASPIVYVDEHSPPTMIIQGTSDELVPNAQADQLKQRLDSLRVPCADYRFPLWPHAMIVVQRVYDFSKPKMEEFLERYLNPKDQ